MRRTPATLLLAAALAIAACAGPQPADLAETITLDGFAAQIEPSRVVGGSAGNLECVDPAFPAAPWQLPVVEHVGRVGGADYVLFAPAHWNGELVLFAHGYVAPSYPDGAFPFDVPIGIQPGAGVPADVVALRDLMLCQGYALAASSYRTHGYAVEDGVRDTHLLNAVVRRHLGGPPARTYVLGQSMGGLIAVALAERFPATYDGALAFCGPIAGSPMQLDYVGHVRVLTHVFLPQLFDGAHPFATPAISHEAYVSAFLPRLETLLGQPAQASALLSLASVRLPCGMPILPLDPAVDLADVGAVVESLATSLASALYYYAVGVEDVLARGGGGIAFDNTATVYTFVDPATGIDASDGLNAAVLRISGDPQAMRYWDRHYQPSGDLQVPLVALHTTHDPDVPYPHVLVYEHLLAGPAGAADWLRVDTVEAYGHCNFSVPDLAGAFGALRARVETGWWPPVE
ncbi:MAG: alpha/beta hydrolase [Vicinamibacterales bacterium]